MSDQQHPAQWLGDSPSDIAGLDRLYDLVSPDDSASPSVPAISNWIQPVDGGWSEQTSILDVLETIRQAVRTYLTAIQHHQVSIQVFRQAIQNVRTEGIPNLRSGVQALQGAYQMWQIAKGRRQKKQVRQLAWQAIIQYLEAKKKIYDGADDAISGIEAARLEVADTGQAVLTAVLLVRAKYQQQVGQTIRVTEQEWQNVLDTDQAVRFAIDLETQVNQQEEQTIQYAVQIVQDAKQVMEQGGQAFDNILRAS